MAINNLAALEERRQHLNQVLAEFGSPNFQLIELTIFLSHLLTANNNSLLSAYFTEFLPKYSTLLKNYSPFGIDPLQTESIYSIAEKYLKTVNEEAVNNELSFSITKIKNQFDELKKILEGGTSESSTGNCLLFPVLEKSDDDKYFFGFLETITISISKRISLTEDTFVVVPDFGQSDNRLNQQIQSSWDFAKNYFAGSIKASKHFHEVVIRFNKKYGIYEGGSFGIALTIGFIQELIRFYNLRDVVTLGSNIASTGSVNEKGEIDSVGVESIEKKVEAVFYSKVQRFIIPFSDLATATKRINLLHKKYPKRELEIIGIPIISDLIDRRSLVSIKKQNIIKWGAKKTLKNKLSIALLVLLVFTSSYFLVKDFDDNPVGIDFQSVPGIGFVKNKLGKTLWEINEFPVPGKEYAPSHYFKNKFKIFDTDGDGKNELFLCEVGRSGTLFCLNSTGSLKWKFDYRRIVETPKEKFSDFYRIHMIVDIIKNNGVNELIVAAQEAHHYPNPILKINAATGELIDDSFWHPGGIQGALVKDIDNDGKLEVVAAGNSNGKKSAFVFSIEYDKLNGTAPTIKNYTFLNQQVADFDQYILLPKTDLSFFLTEKYNSTVNSPHIEETKQLIDIKTIEDIVGYRNYPLEIYYDFTFDFSDVRITIPEGFVYKRDSLVRSSKLDMPLTGTSEYKEKLQRNIQRWNGKEFVQMFPQNVEMNEGTISIQNK
ncbi:MAG: hypothetical protein HND52_16380 [Ignavibacteriae bacterium]|nr:hypothetical protein [Ignavibacteriota bacterium]NOG99535.1 hypothetical protein [Ignavibacteriota bacterium]